MTKKQYIMISVGAILGGGLLCGYALANTFGPAISNTCVVLGLVTSVAGFISLVLGLKNGTGEKR